MKRLAAAFAILSLVALTGAVACDKDKDASKQASAPQGTEVRQVSMTGFLTDSHCGADKANAKGKHCTLECIKKGAKLQLYSSDKLYTLDKVEAAETHIGVEVKVTGTLDEATNTIKVDSIENVSKG
jgi:hypothetical protein